MVETMYAWRRRVFAVVVGGALLALTQAIPAQTTAADDVVLWTSAVPPADIHGDWVRTADPAAAGAIALYNTDRGRARISSALPSPANYFEMRFTAKRSTAYQVWVRMRASGNSTANDSVHLQFNDSVDGAGQATARIGSSDSLESVLQNGPGGGQPQGWGWTDTGWGSLGSPIYFAADGTHVVRIQQREDGALIDQIVLSPQTFAATPPGTGRNDATIVPAAGSAGPATSASTVVLRPATAAAGRMFGAWRTSSDATAAGGQAVRNPNAGAAKITPALSNPADYFEATFNADAGKAYHVWVRMRADANSLANDSVHVQFSDSVSSSGASVARIGTASSFEMVLQDGSGGPAPDAWGWTDNGWDALGGHLYFATTGAHTIRIQRREDGTAIDQIMLSPDTFLTTPPGWRRTDQTIYAGTPAPRSNLPPSVTLTAPASGASYTAPATVTLTATASDPENQLTRVDFYNGAALLGSDAAAPYAFTWSNAAAGSYQLKAVAVDSQNASASSAISNITVSSAPSNQPPTVSLTAPASGATFTAPATISLAASASDPENQLARVEFRSGSTVLGSDTTAPFTFAWTSVPAGTYTLTARAFDSAGSSATSSTVSVTVNSATSFPAGQQHQDIGSPAIAGNATFNSGTYTVSAAGIDIWNTSDQFHFVYQQMTGDVEITARVGSLQGSTVWSKAGVMVRESLTGSSRHALAHITVGNGFRFIRRTATGGTSTSTACAAGTAPGWVRLTRRGDSFEMRYSSDGQTWTSCGTTTMTMASTVYVGLAVSNCDATQTATAVVNNLSITSLTGNQPPSVSLTAPASGATYTAPATVALTASASDPENRLAKVDFYNGSMLLASDTSSPFSYSWGSVPAGTYQLKAVATDLEGNATTSSIVTITVGSSTVTRRVAFTKSVDHAVVVRYVLEVFPSTANPSTATPMTTSDLGKPTPDAAGEIIVDRTTFLNGLAVGNYLITVAAVGSSGSSRSTAIAFSR